MELEEHFPLPEPRNSPVRCQNNGSEEMRLLGIRALSRLVKQQMFRFPNAVRPAILEPIKPLKF